MLARRLRAPPEGATFPWCHQSAGLVHLTSLLTRSPSFTCRISSGDVHFSVRLVIFVPSLVAQWPLACLALGGTSWITRHLLHKGRSHNVSVSAGAEVQGGGSSQSGA